MQWLTKAHGALIADPSSDAVHRATHPTQDQQDGCKADLQPELISEAGNGGYGYACGKETEACANPGKERTFIGETEAWIRFRADPVDRPWPATVARAGCGGVTHSVVRSCSAACLVLVQG